MRSSMAAILLAMACQASATTVTTLAHVDVSGSTMTVRCLNVAGTAFESCAGGSAAIQTVTVAVDSFTLANAAWFQLKQGTVAVTGLSGASLATAANQATEISSLSSIDGKITAMNTGAVTISAALPAGTSSIGRVTTTVNVDSFTAANAAYVRFPVPQPFSVAVDSFSSANPGYVRFAAAQTVTVGIDSTTMLNPTHVRVENSTMAVVNAVGTTFRVIQTVDVDSFTIANAGWLNVKAGTVAVTGLSGGAVSVVEPTLTKGTQGSTGVSTQDLKDAGRANIAWTANRVASTATAEGLFTLQRSAAGAAAVGSTFYTITNGKTLRLTSVSLIGEMAGGTPAINRMALRIRYAAAGSCSASSPLQEVSEISLAATAKSVTAYTKPLNEGVEFSGDGTKQLCFTLETPDWVTVTNLPNIFVDINGYEY